MALKLRFSVPQRISLSDWQDPSLAGRGGEAPVTLRYGQDRRTLSRESKMRCFSVLAILRELKVATLGEVTEAGWAKFIEQSKPMECDAFDATELWRNIDVTEPSRKFRVRVCLLYTSPSPRDRG